MSLYSSSVSSKEEAVTVAEESNNISLELIRSFFTCVSNGKWWLGCVIEVIPEDD